MASMSNGQPAATPLGVGWLVDPNGPADVGNGLAVSDQLLSGLAVAVDLRRDVADSFHGPVHEPARPDEDSHSPRTDFGVQVRPVGATSRSPQQVHDHVHSDWYLEPSGLSILASRQGSRLCSATSINLNNQRSG